MHNRRWMRWIAFALSVTMLLSLAPGFPAAAAGRQTVAAWFYSSNPGSQSAVPATEGEGSLTFSGGDVAFNSSGYCNVSKWSLETYWIMSGMDAAGLGGLQLSLTSSGSATGPANWSAEYSVDNGGTWTAFGAYSVTTSYQEFKLSLPSEAAAEGLMIRLHPSDSARVDGSGGSFASGGTNRLGRITVSGSTGGAQELAVFSFTGITSLCAAASEGWGWLDVDTAGAFAYSKGALTVNNWSVDDSWMLIFNTSGCTGLSLDAEVISSGTGPAHFEAAWSADLGQTWNPLGTYTIENSGSLQKQSFLLPDAAQSTNLLVRLRVTDDEACKGDGSVIAETGTSGINGIVLTGSIGQDRQPDPDAPTWPEGWRQNDPGTENPDPIPGAFVDPDLVGDPVAQWQFSGAASLPADASYGWGTLTHSASGYISYSSDALNQTGWTPGAYWQLVANTTGCTDLTLQMRMASSGTGPRDFSLRYSADLGQTWIEFASFSITSTLKNYIVSLPDAAQAQNLVIRIVVSADVSVKGDVIKNGGNNRINSIGLNGTIDAASRLPNPAAPAYPADWSLPSAYDPGEVYVPEPGPDAEVSDFTYNETDRRSIACWGGNANYAGALSAFGDLISANDRLDGASVLTTVVNGTNVSPGFTTSSTNSTNYYLGASKPCIGSSDLPGPTAGGYFFTGDYIQLAVSTAKYTELGLSFRLRVSGSGPKRFAAQYSTDLENWLSFDSGSYSYAYTAYGAEGATWEVSGEGTIVSGVIPMEVNGQYEEIILDVPAQAANASTLYIRFYASPDRADGKDGGVGSAASVRIDTVRLTGCPMIAAEITDWVRSDSEPSVPLGAPMLLNTGTEGARIFWSTDYGRTVRDYDPAEPPTFSELPVTVTAWATGDGLFDSVRTHYRFTQAQVSPVKAFPNGGAVAEDTQLRLTCATETASIRYSLDNGQSWHDYDPETKPILTRALLENGCTVLAMAGLSGCLNSPVTSLSFTLRLNAEYNLYFGQLHAHTNYSDGAGSCEEAFVHASTEVDHLDFLAVTDHSNAFDNDTAATIYDGSASAKWVSGHALADQYTRDDFVCIYGYEMTWSNGLGHMNTYNTNGFQSRTQTEFASFSTALPNYYAALKSDPNSISQFNHPGTTFGTFQDYAWYDADIDELITIIEVGNGEGAIGSSGYFPSYEEYTRALDLGWHVAPTNNQDNHKGFWGDANTARSVVLADSLTRENVYDAIRNRRVYATEDNDLGVYYTLDGMEMGAILTGEDVGNEVHLKARITDPTDSGSCRVEVIVNGGIVAAYRTVTGSENTVEFTLPANYSYYYLRLTQADGDLAVTAPVWIGTVEAIGVRDFRSTEELAIQGRTAEISFAMYNEEGSDLEISAVEFTIGAELVHTVDLDASDWHSVKSGSIKRYFFDFTWNGIGTTVLNATVRGTLNGVEKQYNGVLQLDYIPGAMVANVIVDGSHNNDYVTGNYAGNTTKLVELGAEHYARVTVAAEPITADLLSDCQLLVISVPARRGTEDYTAIRFEDSFLSLVRSYVDAGGSVVLCGSADYGDSTSVQAHTELNRLLSAIRSTMRIRSDEVVEYDESGKAVYGLEFSDAAAESQWLAGAGEGMTFSVYSACSLDLGTNLENDAVFPAEILIRGSANTLSIDTRTDAGQSGSGAVVVPAGQTVIAAVQDTKAGGHVFLCGAPFFSDFNMENDEHDYKLNAVWMSNILDAVGADLPITPIAQMRQGNPGDVFCVEGWVTNGTDNEHTTFFDTIYLQDETGGVTIYPFSATGLRRGTKLRIAGCVDAYQDDLELQVLRWEILDDQDLNDLPPTVLTCSDAMNYQVNGGLLVQTSGVITEVSVQGESVTQLRLKDETGISTIFIDGYIRSGSTGRNELSSFCRVGNTVSAVGMCFMHPEAGSDLSKCCLRVRDCDEILLIQEGSETPWEACDGDTLCPGAVFTDMPAYGNWAHKAIDWAVSTGVTTGTGSTTFSPKKGCTRAQVVTFLWRAAGSPEPESNACSFTDVSERAFYYRAMLWAVEQGITTGVSSVKFDPGATCTRAQAVTFLYRFAGSPEVEAAEAPFTDVRPGAFYEKAVRWAVANGVASGTSASRFSPNAVCTRAHVVTFLFRWIAGP